MQFELQAAMQLVGLASSIVGCFFIFLGVLWFKNNINDSSKYKSVKLDLSDTYYKVMYSDKTHYTKEDVMQIVGLIHNGGYVDISYFQEPIDCTKLNKGDDDA